MKKVLFVLSTSFSGSTMLDLMLANGENGFSCGEITALFRPWHLHHQNPVCGCGDPNCRVWEKIKNSGEKSLYSSLFSEFPQLNFVVDSSKHLNWMYDQKRYLQSTGFQPVYILIWKEPIEYAYSCWKRGGGRRWQDIWVKYYSNCFSLVDEWVSVKYSDLAEYPKKTIKGLCGKIGIPYFEGKELFWTGKHHTLFGSDSAKAHLLEKESPQFKALIDKRKSSKPNVGAKHIEEFSNHRKIYYDPQYIDKVPDKIKNSRVLRNKIDRVRDVLEQTDWRHSPSEELISEAGKIAWSPLWYQRERTLLWYLRQKNKMAVKTGITTLKSSNVDGG